MKTYKNILLAQVDDIENLFNKILNDNQIKQIVEIGTNRGGLSILLSDLIPEPCKILTLDITKEFLEFDPKEYSRNLEYRTADCFNDGKKITVEWIQKEGQTLVLCDGGNKNQEFNFFSEYLKENDIIMLHDYIDSNNVWFSACKKYEWPTSPESNRNSISNSIKRNNLSEYLYEYSCSYLWGSFKKTG